MADLKLVITPDGNNPDGWDLQIDDGELTLLSGAAAIGQHIEQRLQLFFGEWFLDRRQGVPWFQRIFGQDPDDGLIRSLLSRTIAGTPGVTSVETVRFELDGKTRVLSVDYRARTEDGLVIGPDDFRPLILEF